MFEVLLVIAILALLAAFVVPRFLKVGERAKTDTAKSALGRSGPLATALDLYYQAMGKYPEGEEGLRMLIEPPEEEEDEKKWTGPYLKDVESLKDPWGNEYNYRFPGEIDEDNYEIWSNGPDEEEGTEDDITSWKTDEDE